MALTISEITAKTKASFARPNIFTVSIHLKTQLNSEVLNLNCYNAQIPGISIATTDKDLGFRSVGYQKLYDDVILSFYCRENLNELEIMHKWLERISNPVNNRIGYYDDYKSQIDIIDMSREGKKTLTTTLHEAYPKKIDPIQLDYGTTDIMRMTVNFTYRHFTQVWGEKKFSNLKAIHKNESDEDFRGRMGLKVAPENQLKKTFPRGQFDS